AELRVEPGRAALQRQAVHRRLPHQVEVQATALELGDRAHHVAGAQEAVELEVGEGLVEQRGVEQEVAAGQGRLQAQLVAVDELAGERGVVDRGDTRTTRRQAVGR